MLSRSVMVVWGALALAACGPTSYGDREASAFQQASFNQTPATTEYGLSTGDLLDITVFQVPDLTRTVQVSPSGSISLPLIGEIKAGGKTPHQLEVEITAKLKARYLQSPQVSVFLKSSAGQVATVDGAVKTPGVYAIQGQMSLVQALARAGGLDSVGDSTGILIFRSTGAQRTAARFNLDEIRAGRERDPQLVAGDTIEVDTSGTLSAWKGVRETLPALGLFAAIL